MDPLLFDSLGDVMRAARAAAQAQARALRPDTPPVEVPREASPVWLTEIRCAYCSAPLELATEPTPPATTDTTWDTVTAAICTNDRCRHPFDIHMRLRPRAPRRPHLLHHRNRAAVGAALLDTINGTH